MLCPHCGAEDCKREKCLQASARLSTLVTITRGLPNIRKPQREQDRVRKSSTYRLLPVVRERIRRAAEREGLGISEFVERWALSLPEE